jgi:hypothetical protein
MAKKHEDEAEDKKLIKSMLKKEEKKLGVKKMAKGGVASVQEKAMGRNLARIANQGSKK